MNTEISLEDLESVSFALEGWLDAFQDDDVFEEDYPRVKKVYDRMLEVIAEMRKPDRPKLRLISPKEEK